MCGLRPQCLIYFILLLCSTEVLLHLTHSLGRAKSVPPKIPCDIAFLLVLRRAYRVAVFLIVELAVGVVRVRI
jgi:hypothetical protein